MFVSPSPSPQRHEEKRMEGEMFFPHVFAPPCSPDESVGQWTGERFFGSRRRGAGGNERAVDTSSRRREADGGDGEKRDSPLHL